MWDLSCRDWADRLRSGRSLVPDLPLFRSEADLAVQFFDALHLPDVPGRPKLRDAAGDWFRDIVRALFGSRDPTTNERHIREIFAMVGKGNSKTSYGAGLMVVALLMNERPRAEFLLVAPTQSTADLAFAQAVGMIEADQELQKRFHPRDHVKEIRDRLNGSKLKIKTFGLDVLTGPKPVGVLLDELHLLGRSPATTKVMRQIRGGLEKNTEGFLLIITTQSDEQPAGAFKDELAMARAVRDGQYQGRMLPVLYELPPEIASDPQRWQDPAVWSMVMPNLGRSLQLGSLIADWEAERVKGQHAIQVWASQHLNIEIGVGMRSDRWPGAEFWEAAGRGITLDDLLARSEVVVVGIDGGGLDDLLGLAVLGRCAKTRRWLLWCHAWAHPIVLERRKEIAPRLRDFERAGSLTMVERPGDDVAEVAAIVARIRDANVLASGPAIAVDSVGIVDIVDELTSEAVGFEIERIVAVSQGYRLNGAIKTTERKVAGGELEHDGSAMMAWCVGNAKAEARGNAILVTKQAAGTAKIDPLMAVFNAVTLMALNPAAERGRSVYETRGLRVA